MIDISCCPGCGCSLPADAPGGLCPECLLRAGLGEESDEGFSAAAIKTPAPSVTPSAGRAFVPPAPAELVPLFPHLEILELLGHGGMGAVYKARQTKLDRLVALKIIRPESAVDAAFAERFTREARTLARLTHAGIVGVHDFGEVIIRRQDGEQPLFFFVMEYVDGLNLRQLMDGGNFTVEQALAIVPQICDSLQYAHDQGVVHRDIKPENILLDRQGRVKIADFGLARLVEATGQDFTLTTTHQVMGTPRYMSPEQMAGSHAVDHRADIYSLGVVFYELLTGEVPMGQFEPPSRKAAIDTRLDEVVMRALAREPERRFQSASDLRSRVDAISSSVFERTVLPRRDEGGRGGFSTILEREAVAAWQWVAGDSVQQTGEQRRKLPALLMILLCLAGCATVLFAWIEVEFLQADAAVDASTSAMAVVTAGYGVLAFQEGSGWFPQETPLQVAAGRHSVAGLDMWPGIVFCILLALLALLLIALPDRQRRRTRWLLLMATLSTAALVQTFLFVGQVEGMRFHTAPTQPGLTSQQNPSTSADHLNAAQSVYFQVGEAFDPAQQGAVPQRLSRLEHRLVYRPAWMCAVGVSLALLLLSTTGVRHALSVHETGRSEPASGRTPRVLSPGSRLVADAPQHRPVLTPVAAEPMPSGAVSQARVVSPARDEEDKTIQVQSEIDGASLALILTGVLFLIGHAIAIGVWFESPNDEAAGWIGLSGLMAGTLMLIGGWNLRGLRSRGWAQVGAWTAIFPSSPGWFVSLFAGISAKDVLDRPHVRHAFLDAARQRRAAASSAERQSHSSPGEQRTQADSTLTRHHEELFDDARSLVDGPAISLLTVGLLAAVGCLFALITVGGNPFGSPEPATVFVVPGIILGLLIAAGAWCMRSLRAYGMAMTAGVLCMLPTPALLVTLPLGIWALRTLARPDVRHAFVLAARRRREVAALDTRPQFSLKAIVAAGAIALTLLLAIPTGLLYVAGRFSLEPGQTPTILLSVLGLPLLVLPLAATVLGFIAVSEIRHSNGRMIGLGLAFADAVFFPTLLVILGPGTAISLDANPGTTFVGFLNVSSVVGGIAAIVLWLAWRSVKSPV